MVVNWVYMLAIPVSASGHMFVENDPLGGQVSKGWDGVWCGVG